MKSTIITITITALVALIAACQIKGKDEQKVFEDYDGDGIPDALDNCPLVPNAAQADSDNDKIGDVCDPDDLDRDGDGYSTRKGDCDDSDAAVHPGAKEVCDDGDDNDCDGYLDCTDQDCLADKVCEHVITDAGTDADAAADVLADATEDVVAEDVPVDDAVAADVPVDDGGALHALAITYTPPSGGAVDIAVHGHFCEGVGTGDAYGCGEWYQLGYVPSGTIQVDEDFSSAGVFEFNVDFEDLAPFHACAQPSGGGPLSIFGTLAVRVEGAVATPSVVTNHMSGCNLRVSIP